MPFRIVEPALAQAHRAERLAHGVGPEGRLVVRQTVGDRDRAFVGPGGAIEVAGGIGEAPARDEPGRLHDFLGR